MSLLSNCGFAERERLRVLHEYGVLDTPEEPVFDDITMLAAKICETPISLVSLVDYDRQWFKSHHGLPLRELPRRISFCTHTIQTPADLTVVTDASRDPRFADNPLVVAEPSLRFYAAAPLLSTEGYALGTVCVLDRTPRQLTRGQLDALRALARQAMNQLELRRSLRVGRTLEAQYQELFSANPMPMWVYDRETLAVLAINDAALGAYGVARACAGQLEARALLPPEEHERFESYSARPLDAGELQTRWRHRRSDGTEMTVDVFAHEIVFAGRPARIVQVLDRTDEERAIAALRQSEERFASAARAVSDVIWDWNLATGVLWWSEGFHTLFGHAADAGTSDSRRDQIHPEDRSRVLAGLHRALDGREPVWSDEYRFQRSDGAYAVVLDRGQILRDAAGRPYRMIGGMTDLTERKQLESQFLRAQRMESIGALAGGIAHDLNNVLAPILMSTTLLEGQVTDPDALRTLRTIEVSARRGANLIRQVLSFARGVEDAHTAVELEPVLAEAVRLARETFPRSISFHVECPPNLWPANGDPTHLHQVLMNLLVNARDAMPDGGRLEVSAWNAELPDAACIPFKRKGGRYVITAVRDSGTGIPTEIVDRIFEPFFTTKPQGAGTGPRAGDGTRHRGRAWRLCPRQQCPRRRRHLRSLSARGDRRRGRAARSFPEGARRPGRVDPAGRRRGRHP